MNKLDRERLQRIAKLLDRIPFPHDGGAGPSASLRGMVTFQNDARFFIPRIRRALNDMIFQSIDTPENEIECGVDYDDPNEIIGELERWVDRRNRERWD